MRQFISYLCTETGLLGQDHSSRKQTFLIMLEDAIVLNVDSVRDGDRLTMIEAANLRTYLSKLGKSLSMAVPQEGPIISPSTAQKKARDIVQQKEKSVFETLKTNLAETTALAANALNPNNPLARNYQDSAPAAPARPQSVPNA